MINFHPVWGTTIYVNPQIKWRFNLYNIQNLGLVVNLIIFGSSLGVSNIIWFAHCSIRNGGFGGDLILGLPHDIRHIDVNLNENLIYPRVS